MKVLFAVGALSGAMFGRVVYLYLEARAAYMRRARRPSGVPVSRTRSNQLTAAACGQTEA